MVKIILTFLIGTFICLVTSMPLKSQELTDEVYFDRSKRSFGYGIKKMKNPEVFQGNRKNKKYFEGWYFKMVSEDGSSILSVIPGISLSQNGEEQHAFIQVIDGKTAETYYFNYPIKDFQYSPDRFAIRIGTNYFSKDNIILDIKNDSTSFRGEVRMSDQVDLTNQKEKKKGIMGWYRYVPFMQCYHGVVSLTHNLTGSISKGNETYNFNNGSGYIEKDWGKSMPSAWIWIQSNNFSSKQTSFMVSIANIPWLGSSFTGFLGFFYHDNTTQRFGTYTNAKVQMETSNSDTVKITITDKAYIYHLKIHREKAGLLKAPVQGSMDRRIAESIDAKLELMVVDKTHKVVFHDSTSIAGFEMVGDIERQIKDD